MEHTSRSWLRRFFREREGGVKSKIDCCGEPREGDRSGDCGLERGADCGLGRGEIDRETERFAEGKGERDTGSGTELKRDSEREGERDRERTVFR